MEGIGMQMVVPVVGIVAVAAATFYAVSFSEIREKSFRELDDKEDEDGVGFQNTMSSRERRARRKASKKSNS
ncbi:Argininosuccinate lyase [Bienertia sinuspersici]